MGNLIGMRVDLDTSHPEAFVDAVYAEVFDHHPDADEVDAVIQVTSEEADDGTALAFTVVDYRVYRADDAWFGDAEWNESVDDASNHITRFMEMDAWGRSAGTQYMVVHKHPEGHSQPSGKDRAMGQVFCSIDFARTPSNLGDEDQPRTCVFVVVLNRTANGVVELNWPVPIGVAEIDLAVEARSWDELVASFSDEIRATPDFARLTETHAQYRQLLVASFEIDNADLAAIMTNKLEAFPILREMKELIAKLRPHPIEEMLQRLRDLLPDVTVDSVVDNDLGGMASGTLGGVPFEEMLNTLRKVAEDIGIEVVADQAPRPIGFQPPAVLPPGAEHFTEEQRRIFGAGQPPSVNTDEVILPPENGRPDVPDIFRWVD